MRVRFEHFGAWVSLPDDTLVAIDRVAARALGLDGAAHWDDARPAPPPAPLEAHVAVTSRCPVACAGCYQGASPEGAHVPIESLHRTLDALAGAGVFTVAFGGGEPLLRDDLSDLAGAARARGLTPVVTVSGVGLTRERARALRAFAQVNVSHDGVAGGYRAVRGFEGAAAADRAIALLAGEGIPVGVNFVLTRESFAVCEATADHVRALGARELQLLRYKPAGRAASLDYLARRLTPAQGLELYPLLGRLTACHGTELSVRVDCALIPFFSPHGVDPSALALYGVFGCEAGHHLCAVSRDGAVSPCSFAEPSGAAPTADWNAAWQNDPALERFRAFVRAPPEPCASCAIRDACRGGCKVVSGYVTGDFSPDPECPRVIAHTAVAPTAPTVTR